MARYKIHTNQAIHTTGFLRKDADYYALPVQHAPKFKQEAEGYNDLNQQFIISHTTSRFGKVTVINLKSFVDKGLVSIVETI